MGHRSDPGDRAQGKVAGSDVFNRTPPRGKLVDAVRKKIRDAEVPVAQTVLGNRVAFAASMMEGKGVVESNPRHTATKEIKALADEIAAKLGLG